MASGATLLTVTPDDCTPDAAIEAFEREDYQIAFQLWLTSATEGNSEAQVMLSCLYQTGLGVERNALKAEHWLLKAAAQNDPVAWNNLGSLYALRLPELKDRWGNAQKCWERAKELGVKVAEPYPPPISESGSD